MNSYIEERKHKTRIIVAVTVLLIVAAILIAIAVGVKNGSISLGGNNNHKGYNKNNSFDNFEKWSEDPITYNGQTYQYNQNCKTYLIMGIDREGAATKVDNHLKGGQSDAMFLLITDDLNKNITVIPINRNTMTLVKTCTETGEASFNMTMQVCLAHGYGDGMRTSCQNSVNAVSNLFYNIPIRGYIAMNMDAMMILNHLAGGVEVEVLQDISYERFGVELHKGEVKTLTDEEAYAYLRYRDTNEFASANVRLEREKQYSYALYEKLKSIAGGSKSKAMDMYNELEDYLCTNIIFADIVEDLLNYGFNEENIYNIEGEYKMGKNFEEFYVDNESLYAIIIKSLYNRVDI